MPDGSPEDDGWLRALIERTPVLPDPALRRHWRQVVPWLPRAARYELASTLLDVELACAATTSACA